MTFRTTTSPLDQILLTEWRTWLKTITGIDYTNLDAAVQAEFQFLVDEAHEWVGKEYGHEPWGQQTWTVTAADISAPSTTDGTFLLPIDCRHPILFQESEDGTGDTGMITGKKEWMVAGAGLTSHPWDSQDHPYYFRDGTDDSEPPQVQWRRVPTPASTISKFTLFGRGYFSILGTSGDSSYTMLPAFVRPELRHHLKATWFASRGEYEKVQPEMALRDDAVRSSQKNDAPDGAEILIRPDAPQDFYDEMRGP